MTLASLRRIAAYEQNSTPLPRVAGDASFVLGSRLCYVCRTGVGARQEKQYQ